MKAQVVHHVAPRQVQLASVELPALGDDDVVVTTEVSALSAGTERLVLRGEVEADVPLDPTLTGQQHAARYPFAYGYCAVGRVTQLGARVQKSLLGQRVFGFVPHATQWVAPASEVIPLPADVSAVQGTFLANVETAVSLVMDGAPVLGEAVAVVGLGVVGHLVAAVLSRLSLGPVTYVDVLPARLASARAVCGVSSASPSADGVDLAFELTGRPEALETALSLCRREGRVVVGSWYGSRAAPLHFGTRTHRAHQSILFSNVSTISSALAGRFDKARRMAVAMSWLQRLPLEPLVTHRVPIARCDEAFAVLDEPPPGCLQVVLTYPPLEA